MWVKFDAPEWFQKLYGTYGKKYATFIADKPVLKSITKYLMDFVVEKKRSAVYERV